MPTESSNHCPFFPDNLLKLTHDFIKDHLRHKNECKSLSCYCKSNNLIYNIQTKFVKFMNQKQVSKTNLDYFLDCSSIDGGYVTLLIETGKRALSKSTDLPSAQICFEEAHRIDPTNWFVLDTLMGICFVLNDHNKCLQLAIKGLMKDGNYFKARVLISEMLERFPSIGIELPVELEYLHYWNSSVDIKRKKKLMGDLENLKKLNNIEKESEKAQENVLKSLCLDLDAVTLSSLQSLISAIIHVNNEMAKHKVNLSKLITLKVSANPAPYVVPAIGYKFSKEKSNNCNKRKTRGSSPDSSAKRRSVRDKKAVDATVDNMYKKIFFMFPESVLTREIVQEDDELEMKTHNEDQVEDLILTRFLSKQKPFVSKGKQIYNIVGDLLCEIGDQATLIKLPSNFMELYRIHQKWYPLPSPLTCSKHHTMTVEKAKFILTANEVDFKESEAIFLTESIPYLRDSFNPNEYNAFFIRLLILRGIKESKVDYLLMANEMFTKTNLKLVRAANQTVYTSSSLRSMINKMNENNLDTLLDQHRHEEIVELLASKSELSKQEEEYLCQAIQSSKQWKRGIEIIARSKQLTDTLLNLLPMCLKNGDKLSIDRELAIKLLKLGTEDYNAIAWTCILQTFINEMRVGKSDEGKITGLINSAHEYLGNKGACCHPNGEFLSLALDYLINQCSRKKERLIQQCFGCFYKQLECSFLTPAHHGAGVSLSLNDVVIIYNYYIPKKLPEFETNESTSSQAVELFKRLLAIIPDNLNPEKFSNLFNEYLDNVKPIEASSNIPRHHVTQDIYYYLADYYFKNKKFKEAKKFYQLDLTLNRDRFDSWAAYALLMADSMIPYFSKDCRVFYSYTNEVLFLGATACRCFNEAIRLKNNKSKVWAEYGKCAYDIASYISRVKRFGPENLNREEMKQHRKRFYEQARVCFESANNIVDADKIWLNYYYLGKIAERSNILQALRYYELSDLHLALTGATYPCRLGYYSSYYTRYEIEALEVHYRIHSSVLKYIRRNSDKLSPKTLSQIMAFLTRAERSFFVEQMELPSDEFTDEEIMEDVNEVVTDLVGLVSDGILESDGPRLCQRIVQMCQEAMNSNASNFFNGIWKIPNNYIERPGSFISHMLRSTHLLINVHQNLGDAEQLMRIAIHLGSCEQPAKGYLRDIDQENLGKRAMKYCFSIYENRIADAIRNHENLEPIEADLKKMCNQLIEIPIYKRSAEKFLGEHGSGPLCITID
ncbi:uncharacterized protein LOC128391746 isoform X2 [Panonychus citri]|uniref:uncharacterized protein LOC128391746 isoform X2 n=1 Tax=Panonychus citri TaxID=50023 RepID=UPI0023070FCE|nr:uncharacterized protein LOC128391746 isoform X2 [Panonychus citri]